MPNITLNKYTITNCAVKLSTLISTIFKKGFLKRIDIKYCKSDDTNTSFKITYLNCRVLDFNKTYGVMKDSCDLMKSLLQDSFGYHGRLRSFIKAASYLQILFHKKGEIKEGLVELNVNSLYAAAMTLLRIPGVG
jgi:hypothetical protein